MTNNQLPTDYQNFIALSRYARWKEDEQRRETWGETVSRYFDYMTKHLKDKHSYKFCLLYTSPSPRDGLLSRMPSSA